MIPQSHRRRQPAPRRRRSQRHPSDSPPRQPLRLTPSAQRRAASRGGQSGRTPPRLRCRGTAPV